MSRFKIKEVELRKIRLVDKNAHYMDQSVFNQLVANIKRDGQLSSVPFCLEYEPDKYEVISGNHRVQAAQMAGLSIIPIMYSDSLTNDEKRAIQLSHNSLVGKDDLEILKDLMDEIRDASLKEYTGVDESIFESLNSYQYDIVQPRNSVVTFNLTFFETDKDALLKLCEEIEENKDYETTALLPMDYMDRYLEVVGEVQKKYKLKALGLTMMKIVELAMQKMNNE